MPSDPARAEIPSAAAAPLVSIIIPTFNGGSRLEQTLKSCLMIANVAVEILLIDDGSTDGTPDRISKRFPSIQQHRLPQSSGSGSAARNAGLAMARGDYVKFLDHDDLIQPRGFQLECEEALRSGADIVISRWGVVEIDRRGRFDPGSLKLLTPPDPKRLIEAILLGETTPFTAAALYKRSFVGADQWDANATMIDDFDWFCRQAIKGGNVSRIDSISYFWCLHPGSIQGRSRSDASLYRKLTFARYRTYAKLEQSLQSNGQLTLPRRQLLARRYYDVLRCFARYDSRQCWEIVAKIKRLDPDFDVDASCEPDPRSRRLIHAIGLPMALLGYGAVQRFRDGIRHRQVGLRSWLASLKRPSIQARDRG